jgi:hydroxymethylpyrimidine/phosphomethylpyrimidine kinase
VVDDIGVDAVKVGMLGAVETTEAVVVALGESGLAGSVPIVVDPVMVAESGAVLLDPEAKGALIERLLPLATVTTPNLAEARELAGLGEEASLAELAKAIRALGPGAVVVTGGHTSDGADFLCEGEGEPLMIAGRRYPDGASHGSGCTHSSTLAAQLARGASMRDAAFAAKAITAEAVGAGLRAIGRGAGPVDVLGARQVED